VRLGSRRPRSRSSRDDGPGSCRRRRSASPVPVVGAGGIADGRDFAATLALGAAGAWIGTRFLASEEAFLHPRYRESILQARETDTVHSILFDGGWPGAQRTVSGLPRNV